MLSRDLRNIALALQKEGQRPADLALVVQRLQAIAEGVENLEAVMVPPHLRAVIPVEQLGERVVPLRRP